MINISKKYNLLSKEHNGDWVSKNIIKEKYKLGLNSINIAPELGELESKVILDLIKDDNLLFVKMYNLCLNSNKWKKWVNDDFIPNNNKEKLILICGHYIFSKDDFKEIIDKIGNIYNDVYKKINFFLK